MFPVLVKGECTCDGEESEEGSKSKALKFKIGAIVSILVFGGIGVCIPVFSKIFPSFEPGKDFFFMMKAFAAGVILATGFIHVLPDAFEHLSSPCLGKPWSEFPFTGFIAMMAAIGTLIVDTIATSYYKNMHFNKAQAIVVNEDEEKGIDEHEHDGHVHVHTHATHGHAHGSVGGGSDEGELIRHRVISNVLELGIIVHSVIIGISLGASEDASTIKTLLIALSFHQFFEGMGLGGCIAQAKFKTRAVVLMIIFFAFTTPLGIGIGIGISNGYKENSPTALIVEGVLNSASSGILIYMALVDLLAADFMSAKIQGSGKLLLQVCVSLLLGVGMMSTLAKWA
ncbi:Zinc transporter [Thalictrum thalictroides]|uniref:Zinc transporter n=1 Tax=Thalictrum thalictroides TaxID=46969 RepID=A0A7J6VK56_THATH|nr:Zinc transporter [Thalictrum thalictroides]